MKIELRAYQQAAVREAAEVVRAGLNPVICIATGGGKSLIGAELCRALATATGGRNASVMSITHTRELIRQNAAAFGRYQQSIPHAIYSAGLGEKRLDAPVVFGGVQSLVNAEFDAPDAILVDEAHRVPFAMAGQYGAVFSRAPSAIRLGMTATPYRLDGGVLHKGEGAMFDALVQPTGCTAYALQKAGYLSPLVGVVSRAQIDTRGIHSRGGEFINSELEQVATEPGCVDRVCRAIMANAQMRRAILVFSVSILHAEMLAEGLNDLGCRAAPVSGKTPKDERDQILAAFAAGELRALVNCAVLTTGYDYPGIDCIACVRPTQSMSLWVQMVGRGLRKAEGKENCQILDFGGNWNRHGRDLDGLPDGDVEDQPKADKEREEAEIRKKQKRRVEELNESSDGNTAPSEFDIKGVYLKLQTNKKNPLYQQIMVTYVSDACTINIWLLPEHGGKASYPAKAWFARRGVEMPRTAREGLLIAEKLENPKSITAYKSNDFWRIKCEHFG